MVLNSFNDVTLVHGLKGFLGDDGVEIVERYQEVVEVTLTLLEGSGVSESTLVIGHGPFGGAHNSQVMVKLRVHTAQEGVLACETLASYIREINIKAVL